MKDNFKKVQIFVELKKIHHDYKDKLLHFESIMKNNVYNIHVVLLDFFPFRSCITNIP